MKTAKILDLLPVSALVLVFLLSAGLVSAQSDAPVTDAPHDEEALAEDAEEYVSYSEYKVKAYSLTGFYGDFSGATYLENKPMDDRTVQEDGAADILAYDGGVLLVSRDTDHYEAAHKEIQSGPAFGGRIGMFVNRDFHLDLVGYYATGKAVTSMQYTPDPVNNPSESQRVVVDEDPDFSLVKGGVHLAYDARPAKFWGITPTIGFGLGGLINRYSELNDKTALYLEGNLGFKVNLFDNISLAGQADLTTFAYDVDELGYSNIVKYKTYTLGITWFIDVIPPPVRSAHTAELEALEEG
ncbi:MAG: hypothetical protein GY780_18560 [bacterium]|nr:hypothetical protein [bacterium]